MSSCYASETKEFTTIIDFLRFGLSRASTKPLYFGHGTDNLYDDMHALILGSLHLPFDIPLSFLEAKLTTEEKLFLSEQLEKRIENHIPVPYLTNQAFFAGLEFFVDERVLIPRSPLAELIQQQFSPWIDGLKVQRILDLCTGSGCIAIACCYAFPEAEVDAIDISKEALDVARMNRQQHALEEQLELIQSNGFEQLRDQRYDIIISNPPYVGHQEMITLPKEYQHEPKLALEAENNGLALVETILHQAHRHLTDEGILVVEVGNSEETLIEAYPDVPFTWLDFEHGGQGVFLLTKKQLKHHFGAV